jgi:hypothetical protein
MGEKGNKMKTELTKQQCIEAADTIAKVLGAKHDLTLEGYWAGNFTLPSGDKIHVRLTGGQGGKGYAVPCYARDIYINKELLCEIKFNPLKDAKAIARDIQKRLLPDAEKLWADEKEKLARKKEYDDKVAANKKLLSKYLESYQHDRETMHVKMIGNIYGKAQVSSEGFRIEFSNIKPECLLEMFKVIEKYE